MNTTGNPYGLSSTLDLYFISSVPRDRAQANWVANVISGCGKRVFRPWLDCRPGIPDWRQVEEALDRATHVVVVLSGAYKSNPPIEWNSLHAGGVAQVLTVLTENCGHLTGAWGANPIVDLRGVTGNDPDPARQTTLLMALQQLQSHSAQSPSAVGTVSLSSFCPRCGNTTVPTAKFCRACGQSLTSPVLGTSGGRGIAGQTGLLTGALKDGKYVIVRRLGKGGMGAVYLARDLTLDRMVAVKEMSLSAIDPADIPQAIDSFRQEARMLAALRHSHLPHIYEHFQDNLNGRWYLVMDFIEGETLEDRLEKMPGHHLGVKETLTWGVQLCDVLHYLHAHQPPIIFRDLKPANIMVAPDENLFLVDFGIARLFKPGQSKDTSALGSQGYAAPEQYGKSQTTQRSDLYSLGATLHQMLSGDDPSTTPFQFRTLTGGGAPVLGGHPVLEDLNTLILQMVRIDQSQRPASAAEVKAELLRIADAYAQPPTRQAIVGPGGTLPQPGPSVAPRGRPRPTTPPPFPGASSASSASGMTFPQPGPGVSARNTPSHRRPRPTTPPPFSGASSASSGPDASVFVISAPLVAQIEQAFCPDDEQLVEDLRAVLEQDLEQLCQQHGKSFAYRDALGIGVKYLDTFSQYIREASIVLALCTPALLASPYACDLVNNALQERMRRDAMSRMNSLTRPLTVIPVLGIDCDWQGALFSLGMLTPTPRDYTPINQWPTRTDALEEVANDIYSVLQSQI